MTLKSKFMLIAFCAAAILGIFIYRNIDKLNQKADESASVEKEEGEAKRPIGVTRAVAAKMLSLLAASHEEIETGERVVPYTDSSEDKWFDKYVNQLYRLGVVWNAGREDAFGPMEDVSYAQCREALRVIYSEGFESELEGGLSFSLGDKSDSDSVTLSEWLEIYRYLMAGAGDGGEKVIEKDLYVLDLVETEDEVPLWKAVTDKGEYFFDGFALDGLKDAAIHAFVKGVDVVFVDGVLEGEMVLSNAWLEKGNGKELHAFLNGTSKTFVLENELSEPVERVVGDLTIKERKITKVSVKPERINDKVLMAGDGKVELEEYGTVPLDDNYKIYKIYDDVASEVLDGVLVGYQTTDFVVAEGKVQAALITAKPTADTIRVAVKTNGFASHYHDSVKITANAAFTIQYGKKNKEYAAGKTITIKPNGKFLKAGRLRIQTKDGSGKIGVASVDRNGRMPFYRGSMEVKQTDGGLLLVNELSLEEYLYAVIPSEMPTSYGVEALKVQAVCARSYAYKQVVSNSLKNLGAHVDDSVSYQVYNNTPENEQSVQAVKETEGKVLQYGEDVATAYYFSTSCGHTAGAGEVWISDKTVPYLTGKLQVQEGADLSFDADLSKEENFKNFIVNNPCKTYDENFAWYRWNVTVSAAHLKKSIEASIASRYQVNPLLIQTRQEDGSFRSEPIESIGELTDVQVEERKTGGIITSILLIGSERSVRVRSEYNVRLLLAPTEDVIRRKDGSEVNGFAMLPSAFFFVEKGDGGYTFTGGGYGHGVGMSQNGVKAMVEEGKGYEEILGHYYEGAKIGVLY